MTSVIAKPKTHPKHLCIFCGAPANSKEDAWPRWLIKLLKSQLGPKVKIDRQLGSTLLRPAASVLIRNSVCAKVCNNGWMSRLESDVIPILKPLIMDYTAEISSQQQLIISVWAVKCAMVFDCLESPRFFQPIDTNHLFHEQTPPSSIFSVWLGRCSTFTAFTDGKRLYGFDAHTGRPQKGHVLTMIFGHLIIQVLAIQRYPSQSFDSIPRLTLDSVPGPWKLAHVWPPELKPISWPLAASFSGDDFQALENFSNRFNVNPSRLHA
jgi:hypothetical protein